MSNKGLIATITIVLIGVIVIFLMQANAQAAEVSENILQVVEATNNYR